MVIGPRTGLAIVDLGFNHAMNRTTFGVILTNLKLGIFGTRGIDKRLGQDLGRIVRGVLDHVRCAVLIIFWLILVQLLSHEKQASGSFPGLIGCPRDTDGSFATMENMLFSIDCPNPELVI